MIERDQLRKNLNTDEANFVSEMSLLRERVGRRYDGLEIALVESATPSDIRRLCVNNNVYRSAHIGNMAPANLVSGALGARYILYDRNTPSRDSNYYPGHLIRSGSTNLIGDQGSFDAFTPFVPFAKIVDKSLVGKSKSPGGLHLSATGHLFPGKVETQSEYLNRYRDLLEKAIHTIGRLQLFPELFDRSLDSRGVGFKRPQSYHSGLLEDFFRTNQAFIDAAREGFGQVDLPKNPIVCSLLFITLSFILAEAVEAYQKGEDEVAVIYHLAGPDMGNYVTQQRDLLAFLLREIKKAGEIGLPKKILFAVIPTAHLRLVSTREHKDNLNSLLSALDKQRNANVLKKAGGSLERVKSMKEEARHLAKTGIEALGIDLQEKLSLHFSQHDLRELSDLYIPDLVMRMDKEAVRKSLEQLKFMVRKKQ